MATLAMVFYRDQMRQFVATLLESGVITRVPSLRVGLLTQKFKACARSVHRIWFRKDK